MRRASIASVLSLYLAFVALATPALASRPSEDVTEAIGPNCTQRITLPPLPNVIDAQWSPDGTTLALTWFARLPSTRTVTGYREDEITDALDLRSGSLRPLGVGDHPRWSASGRYLSYWGPNADELRVATKDGRVLARLEPTIPEVRWAGDSLLFIEKDEIRTWDNGETRTLSRFTDEYRPRYPRDDVYFSADGERLSLTRYTLDGTVQRFAVVTRTGDVAPLEAEGATYSEWSPEGSTLLLRYPARMELRDVASGATVASVPMARNAVHEWSADGKTLLVGRVSPTVPAGDTLDTFRAAIGPRAGATYTLPNVMGARAFSPDGRYFAGVSRTGLADVQLEVYRCLGPTSALNAADPRDRMALISAAKGRWVRPAAGDISQFLQGSHTGIDVAAPFGSLVASADDGTVSETGWHPTGGGEHVCVRHAAGLESCYYHTSTALVAVGQRVVRGEPIALIGMTGLTTGPHVHWEAKLFGRVVDPLQR